MKAIIIEDEPLSAAELRTSLAEVAPYIEVVATASSVAEAAETVGRVEHDLIFMDIQMPLMNGYETTAAIRAQTLHGGQTIPIVAMTANAFAEDVVLSRNAGMNDHIAKPLDLNKLNDVLRQWL